MDLPQKLINEYQFVVMDQQINKKKNEIILINKGYVSQGQEYKCNWISYVMIVFQDFIQSQINVNNLMIIVQLVKAYFIYVQNAISMMVSYVNRSLVIYFQNQICTILCVDGIVVQEQGDYNDGNLEYGDSCDSECYIELKKTLLINYKIAIKSKNNLRNTIQHSTIGINPQERAKKY